MSVRIVGIEKQFGARGAPAAHDVTIECPAGAITSLIGPSGAGKSTLLRIIAGLEHADRGQVLIDGDDVTRVPAQQRGVGLVFQSYALFQHLTVRKNVAFGLDVRGRPKAEIEARVDELLALVQLRDLGQRYPAQLSGGQRQRVAFARALAIRPRVLLLDEPFGALDARVRVELRDWLLRLHEETQVTTVLVTHDQEEALELSQHVVVMFDGRVVQAGPPLEIYDRPRNAAVAAFLGASVLRGRVHGGRAAVGSLSVPAPSSAADGDSIDAYVRPHDVTLAKPGTDSAASSLAQILKLRAVAGQMKVTLALPSGEQVIVSMPRSEIEALGVNEGDRVQIDVRNASVFVGDFAI